MLTRRLLSLSSRLSSVNQPSTASATPPLVTFGRRAKNSHREDSGGSNWKRHTNEGRWKYAAGVGAPLLGLSWLVTIKDFFGVERIQLDKDPVKEKIKQSWLDRKYGRFDSAIQQLELALEEVKERGEELPITRVLDELANTYFQQGDLEKAEECFKLVVNRLVSLHKKRDSDPQFIGVSLKLADIFAQRGLVENAESGYKHCVRKQMQVMDEHMKKFSVAHGALVEEKHLVDTHGAAYTDPIALFGMCLEAYAHFLVTYQGEDRLREAEEYMDEVLKISYQIYGSNNYHSVNLLNNFGACCIIKNRFELALKYLAIGIDRILYVNECAHLLPGYYCNYSEALWHCGRKEEALEWARKAVQMSRSADQRVHNYCKNFLRDLERDANKGSKKTWWLF